MRIAVDTNVLIRAHLPSLPGHSRVRRFVEGLLADPEATVVLTAAILHELVHVITDARRFTPPVSMSEALALARLYLGRSNVTCLPLDEAALARAFDLLGRHHLDRRRIADTVYAAVLLQHGVKRLVTCNHSDFQLFEELQLIDPTS